MPVKEKVDLIAQGLVQVSLEGGNRLQPKVMLDEKYFQDLCNPWKDALVVKLLGKTVGYQLMKDRLTKLWKLQGGFEIMDVDNGFYMVKCAHLADREKILSEGPWMMFDHYLAVARWTPDFASPIAKVQKTLVWIRFPGLNLLYYDESFLLALASVVGTPVTVDSNTLNVERGRFARICVEIDLTLPMVGTVYVNGHWYKVQYEGLHIICGSCGCYGHHTRDCKNQTGGTRKEIPTTVEGRAVPPVVEPTAPVGTATGSTAKTTEPQQGVVTEKSGEDCELHGDWLVAQRKKRSNKKGNFGSNQAKVGTHVPRDSEQKKQKSTFPQKLR